MIFMKTLMKKIITDYYFMGTSKNLNIPRTLYEIVTAWIRQKEKNG